MLSVLSIASVLLSTSALANDNPMAFVGEAHNEAVWSLYCQNPDADSQDIPELTADLWIASGGDERYHEEAVEWFTVLFNGEAEAVLERRVPTDVMKRYHEYMDLVEDANPDSLSTILADIDALDQVTMKEFSGQSETLLLGTSAVLRSSSELWLSDMISDEGSWEDNVQYQWKDGSGGMGIDWGEVIEADATGFFFGGVGAAGGAALGAAWGGVLTLGTLTIPGAVVGGFVGLAVGSGGASTFEFTKQDEVRDFVDGGGCDDLK